MSRLSRIALLAALGLAVAAAAGVPAVWAAPATSRTLRSAEIVAPRWVYSDGDIQAGVRVVTRKSSGSVRAELELIDSEGASRWRAIQTRTDLGSATYEYSFFRGIADMGVTSGAYTLRTRVSTAGSAAVERTARLIIVDRDVKAIPVCVVVRVTGSPSAGASATSSETADSMLSAADTADLGRLAQLHPELRLSIAVPPFLLDEWRSNGGSGEDTASPDPWSDALASLRRASQAGTPVLRGLYADPDLIAIANATDELRLQLDAGDATVAATIAGDAPAPSAITTGIAALSGPLPEAVASFAAGSGVRFVVVGTPSVLLSNGATATPGPYTLALPGRSGSSAATLILLAVDSRASRTLVGTSTVEDLAGDLFARASSNRSARGVILEVMVGPDGVRTSVLEEALGALTGLPWLRFVDAPEAAAAAKLPKATLRVPPVDPSPAPAEYRTAVDRARVRVWGLVAAAGADDPDAALALSRLMLAESRAWAGADGSWSRVARGSAFARAADEGAMAVLSKITLDAPDVTLPGSEGRLPVSITNASNRDLTVTLEAASDQPRVRKTRMTVHLRTGENIFSIPVALGTATSGRLKVTVSADGFRIASATATARASYQDRIVLLGAAVLILMVLLFYIRRRMRRGPTGREAAAEGNADASRD